jgi:hypothetical protein
VAYIKGETYLPKFSFTAHKVCHFHSPFSLQEKVAITLLYKVQSLKNFLQFAKQARTFDKYHTPVQVTLTSALQRLVGTQPSTIGRAHE